MNSRERELWQRLESLTIGPAGARLGFTERLARENGWPLAFARRVVQEYKRFLFLAATGDRPVTPSDEVDQAWHLHLVYTESYWNDLCAEILGRPLHHGPTRGGAAEGSKFHDWYQATLARYRNTFDLEPPVDIWPPPAERFAGAEAFRRVDTRRFFLIRRPRWSDRRAVAVGTLAALLGLAGCVELGVGSAVVAIAAFAGLAIVALVLIAALVRQSSDPGEHRDRRNDGTSGDGGTAALFGGDSSSKGGHGGGGEHAPPDGSGGGDGGGDGGGSGCSGGSGCGGGGGCGGGCGGS